MILCTLNGKKAYPSTADKIKVTYENQFINDSGSYTYDINFPMAIHENRLLFGNVQRMDVKKRMADFEDCKLFVDNRLVISGKGTVTGISNEAVKVQIVGGKSRIKYNSKFENHYIDEIDYPVVVVDKGIDHEGYSQLGMNAVELTSNPTFMMVDLTDNNFVGQAGVAAFNPINDETNECISNNIILANFTKIKVNGIKWPTGKERTYMYNIAVQPYLFYVLRKVMEFEGYTIERNDFDRDPWNRLLIASARKSVRIKDALPHWTVYYFLDELRKLFNASIVFDEVKKSVSIISTNELTNNSAVSYPCEDEFSAEYDEDGLTNLATSNVQYQFGSAANRDWREFISQAIQNQYEIRHYASVGSIVMDAQTMPVRQRRSTIFECNHNYFIWAMMPKNGDPESEDKEEMMTMCGFFNPIIRDSKSDNYVDLNIAPVATFKRLKWKKDDQVWAKMLDRMGARWLILPSISNEKEAAMEEMMADEDGEFYFSVQDAIESGSSESSDSSDSETMVVMFQGTKVFNLEKKKAVTFNTRLDGENPLMRWPITFTDFRMDINWLDGEQASLSLDSLPDDFIYGDGITIGDFAGSVDIDKNNLIQIKFVTDDIPDPSNIFLFHNKRFVCQKVELELSDAGVRKEKTGYFYEIIS